MTHDQNFKNLILDYPKPALEFFAAQEAAHLQDARIVPIRQEQLKERLGDRFHELDIPLLVEWPDGKRAALLFVIEEQSQARRFSIHRLAHYCLDLAQLFDTERVVPVVIFLDAGVYAKTLRLGSDQTAYLHFHYLACPLRGWRAADYQDSANIVARLTLPLMRYPRKQRVAVYAHAQDGLAELEPDPERRLKYVDFIDAYAHLNENEWQVYQRDYLEQSTQKETLMGMLSYSRQEGLQQGLQQGLDSERRMLLRLIRRRFGEAIAEQSTPALEQIQEPTVFEDLHEYLLDGPDLAAWQTRLAEAARPPEAPKH
jgi:hypothetical protein